MIYLFILIIYLLGCVLAFGRYNASIYEIREDYKIKELDNSDKRWICFFSLFSWFTFFSGILMYFMDNERYFFKFKIKPN